MLEGMRREVTPGCSALTFEVHQPEVDMTQEQILRGSLAGGAYSSDESKLGEVIACRIVASLVVQYSVYLGAVIVCGLGLWAGVFAGGGSVAITLFPAVLAARGCRRPQLGAVAGRHRAAARAFCEHHESFRSVGEVVREGA
jgi:hypothetical protein